MNPLIIRFIKASRTKHLMAIFIMITMIMSLIPITPVFAKIPTDAIHITNSNILTIDWTQSGKYYVLDEDITLTSEWEPIDILGTTNNRINITFDGNGHSINDLYVLPSSQVNFAGLFGHINRSDVVIKNVGVNIAAQGITASSSDTAGAGGLIGFSDEYSTITIQNSYVTGNVSSSTVAVACAGGLIGNSSGTTTITNSYATGNVSASVSASPYFPIAGAGGLVGGSDAGSLTMTNCYSTSSVSTKAVSGASYAGGLIGIDGYGGNKPTVTNSYRLSTQSVIANSTVNSHGNVLTPEEMQTELSFSEWDFNTVWGYKHGVNDDYPILQIFHSDYTPPTTTDVTFAAVQIGGISKTADSTDIQITFDQAVSGLAESDITISDDTGKVIKGGLSGSDAVYTIALAEVIAEGNIMVSVRDFGNFHVITSPQPVDVYKETTIQATVTNVVVNPLTESVSKGGTKSFSATVNGTNNPAQTVIWAVDGTNSNIDANGILTVGNDETSITLTVTATSTADSTKFGTATVTVINTAPIGSEPIFSIDSNITAEIGQTITVPITVTNNQGFSAVGFVVTYNPNVLEIVSVTAPIASMPLNSEFTLTKVSGIQWVHLVNPDSSNWNGNGIVANITFSVKSDAAIGVTPITLAFTNDPNGVPANANGDILSNSAVISGSINISNVSVLYGDLNDDGLISNADLILMLKYFAQPNTVILNLAAADTNGDDVINNADLILFLKFFALPGIVLGPQ